MKFTDISLYYRTNLLPTSLSVLSSVLSKVSDFIITYVFNFTRASTATVEDFEGSIKNTCCDELRYKGYRRFEPRMINTDTPVYTKVSLEAGDYILSAKGVGSVVTSKGSITGLSNNRKQLLFNLATTTDVTFAPDPTVESWQLENDSGLGIASEYLPCNIDYSQGLTLGVLGNSTVAVTITT
ncbi:MAG: hypothetical protein GQ569_09240, partial [Methylococcaceae bacterium]|nr:hypothetical protein [Methylococcaceae bacterium]